LDAEPCGCARYFSDQPGLAGSSAQLGPSDAVFGPATDGGYWLVGMKRLRPPPSTVFNDVRWSSPHALSDTVKGLGDHRIGYCARLRDVDTVDDLA